MLKYIIDIRKIPLHELSEQEYKNDFLLDNEKAEAAFEKAWATRNFEIELYWKRANYFWAFIASTFVGYFALINSDNYRKPDPLNHVEVYFIICIGFVLACAWFLINLGSKVWQRNWEAHIDLLEDDFTGPLYKSVQSKVTYSVTKINEIVSFSFIILWCLLGAKYFIDNNLLNFLVYRINWFVVVASTAACLALVSMLVGHGRGRFSAKKIKMYRRATSIDSVSKPLDANGTIGTTPLQAGDA